MMLLTPKYGLQADRTTLWAFRYRPSAANVQSTRVPLSRRLSNTEISVLWWLFHRRQNCWLTDMTNGGGSCECVRAVQPLSCVIPLSRAPPDTHTHTHTTRSGEIGYKRRTTIREKQTPMGNACAWDLLLFIY